VLCGGYITMTSVTSTESVSNASNQPFLKLGILLVPEISNDTNLKLAAQAGATDIVLPCPGFSLEELDTAVKDMAKHGLKVSVIERFVPHDKIVHNLPGKEEQIENIKKLIKNMSKCGVKTFCYNWMPSDDWTRTSTDDPQRGGALSTSFNIKDAPAEVSGHKKQSITTPAEELWKNLEEFLKEIIPVCEQYGIDLALHPDDPPVQNLHGQPQIVYDIDHIEKVCDLVPSPRNGICFCQGTFASRGINIPTSIRRLGKKIKFVHARNVICKNKDGSEFYETWQDTGDIDMFDAMKAYFDAGLNCTIRPDHVPTMESEDNKLPGYHLLGRLFALGYLKGLMESVEKSAKFSYDSKSNTSKRRKVC
jgi:mannonate dehydratase